MADGSLAKGSAHAPRQPLSTASKFTYALPAFGLAAAGLFMTANLTKFYVDDVGLGPRLYALSNAIVRSVDLFSYPLAGWLVDSTFFDSNSAAFTGRRKPFLLICAPLVAGSLFLLYAPPPYLSLSSKQAWYVVTAIIYNALPLTLAYYSLGTEVSADYDEQSDIQGWVHVVASVGALIGSLVPGIITAVTASPENNDQGISHMILFPLFALVLALIIAGSFMLLALKTRAPDPRGRTRGDDGGLWETLVTFRQQSKRRAGAKKALQDADSSATAHPRRRIDKTRRLSAGASASADADVSGPDTGSSEGNTSSGLRQRRAVASGSQAGSIATGDSTSTPEDGPFASFDSLPAHGHSHDDHDDHDESADTDPLGSCIVDCRGTGMRRRKASGVTLRRRRQPAAQSKTKKDPATRLARPSSEAAPTTSSASAPSSSAASGDDSSVVDVALGLKQMRAASSNFNLAGAEDDDDEPTVALLPAKAPAAGSATGTSTPTAAAEPEGIPVAEGADGYGSDEDGYDDEDDGTSGRSAAGGRCWPCPSSFRDCSYGCVNVVSCGFGPSLWKALQGCRCRDAVAGSFCCGPSSSGRSASSSRDGDPEPPSLSSELLSFFRALCSPVGGCMRSWLFPPATWPWLSPEERAAEELTMAKGLKAGQRLVLPTLSDEEAVSAFEGDEWTVAAFPYGWQEEVVKAATTGGATLGAVGVGKGGVFVGKDPAAFFSHRAKAAAGRAPSPSSQTCLGLMWERLCCLHRRPVAPWAEAGGDPAASGLKDPVVLVRASAILRVGEALASREEEGNAVPDLAAKLGVVQASDVEADAFSKDAWVVLFPRNGLGEPGNSRRVRVSLPRSAAAPAAGIASDGDHEEDEHRLSRARDKRLTRALRAVLRAQASAGRTPRSTDKSVLSKGSSADSDASSVASTTVTEASVQPPAPHQHGTRLDQPLPMVAGTTWAFRNNIPFRVLSVVYALLSLGAVLAKAMLAFYIQCVLQPAKYELWLGILLAAELVSGVISTPFWLWLSKKYDQKFVWLTALALAMPATLVAFLVMGSGDALPFTLIAVWGGLTDGGAAFLIRALRTSCIDYDALYLKARREAQYLTYLAVLTHWVDIPAAGIGLMALASAGYERDQTQQNPRVTMLIKVFTLLVPLVFVFAAWCISFLFPVNRETHRALFPLSSRAHYQQLVGNHDAAKAGQAATRDDCCYAYAGPVSGTVQRAGGVDELDSAEAARAAVSDSDTEAETERRERLAHWHLPEQRRQRAALSPLEQVLGIPSKGILQWDPISRVFIFPSFVYRGVSVGWVLDQFSATTLRQVLRERRERAAAASQTARRDDDEATAYAGFCCGLFTSKPLEWEDDAELPPGEEDQLLPQQGTASSHAQQVKGGEASVGVGSAQEAAEHPLLSLHSAAAGEQAANTTDRRRLRAHYYGASTAFAPRCCPCVRPSSSYFSVLARETALTFFYLAVTCVSVWLISVGTEPNLEKVAWAAMLLFGLSGLLCLYHGLRIRPAARLPYISSRAIQRHLRLHYH